MQEHTVKGTFPGRYPVVLAGPDVTDHVVFTAKHRQFVIAATRDGKGFSVATNDPPYKVVATKEVNFADDTAYRYHQINCILNVIF